MASSESVLRPIQTTVAAASCAVHLATRIKDLNRNRKSTLIQTRSC